MLEINNLKACVDDKKILEGFNLKIKTGEGDKSYKFGVFGTGGGLEDIQDAIEEIKNQ